MSAYSSNVTIGPPTSGRYQDGDTFTDATGTRFTCVSSGSPGRWDALGENPTNFGWWQVPEGYSLHDDFGMHIDLGGGVHITKENQYDIALAGVGVATWDISQAGDAAYKGYMRLFAPGAGDTVNAKFTGDVLIGGNTPPPGTEPVLDMRMRVAGQAQAAASIAYIGLFFTSYGAVPPLNAATRGVWFEYEWNVDHAELHAHLFDGTLTEDITLFGGVGQTPATYKWLRFVVNLLDSTCEFFTSVDGNAWDSEGVITGLDTPSLLGNVMLSAYTAGDAGGEGQIRLDYWRIDANNMARPSV